MRPVFCNRNEDKLGDFSNTYHIVILYSVILLKIELGQYCLTNVLETIQ